ncbi:PREDICTED: opticin [Acanthisitta chloris]|uniref:opticin n=1 Tax=Acanthisitta chloris TaxID=57068 RepID=UPI0004F0CAB2|nr:PREDICTED: opticin [Acanthisitta chloris]
MWTLAWLGMASLCLGTAWAVPAKERRKVEKPKADLALYEDLDLDNYDLTLDNYGEILDLSNYEELYDYGDLAPKIEVGTLAPRPKDPEALPNLSATAEPPKLQPPTTSGPIQPAPIPVQGLPSCLLCLCIGTSVYCDDADLEHIPPLPPDTTYLYARFNRIDTVRAGDFSGLKKLKRIDLSSNSISRADVDAFRGLQSLQELLLPENRLTALPELPRLDFIPAPLPESLRSLHLQNNNIQTMHEDTFCDSHDHGQIRRALEDIRLDGNPINLSLFPNAYFCLPRLPTGRFL